MWRALENVVGADGYIVAEFAFESVREIFDRHGHRFQELKSPLGSLCSAVGGSPLSRFFCASFQPWRSEAFQSQCTVLSVG